MRPNPVAWGRSRSRSISADPLSHHGAISSKLVGCLIRQPLTKPNEAKTPPELKNWAQLCLTESSSTRSSSLRRSRSTACAVSTETESFGSSGDAPQGATRHMSLPGQPDAGRWMLHPRVALRPEPFGALAYHYDNRRLNFLRSPDLVAVVRTLTDHRNPRACFDANDLDPARWQSFAKALDALAASQFIIPCDDQDARLGGSGCVASQGEQQKVGTECL